MAYFQRLVRSRGEKVIEGPFACFYQWFLISDEGRTALSLSMQSGRRFGNVFVQWVAPVRFFLQIELKCAREREKEQRQTQILSLPHHHQLPHQLPPQSLPRPTLATTHSPTACYGCARVTSTAWTSATTSLISRNWNPWTSIP